MSTKRKYERTDAPTRHCSSCKQEFPTECFPYFTKPNGVRQPRQYCWECKRKDDLARQARRLQTEEGRAAISAAHRKYFKKRRANDPEYRERMNAYERNRYANDPEFRRRRLQYQREQYARKKAAANEQ